MCLSLFHRPVLTGFFRLLLVLLAFGACSQAMAATTYYIRTDGGDATQCTGRGDAAYPGSGSAQNCAWQGPHYALPTDSAARIAGGDTLIIGSGSYMIGWGAPGASGGRCYSGGPYDCYLPPVPSGLSATAKTRILGRGYDTGCTAPPKFWGNNRVSLMLNLEGTSNVEVGCLEITDQSDCVEFHSNPAVRCQRDAPPYGAWASTGVSARAASNGWLHDLNIHGLANRGFVGGGLTNWTFDRVKINANGWAGWDGDIGAASSNAGQIVLRHVEIAWNGCGERWQTGVIYGCWAQQAGGYGDGLGTALTGGQWLIEDSFVHNNTSDGIDLLYLDGSANTSAVIRRVYSAGNAGNQIKTKGNATIENSVVVGNCASFYNRDDMTETDQCRAFGNTLSITLLAGSVVNIRHNTVIGEGDCLIVSGGATSTTRMDIRNNAFIGQLDWRGNLQGNIGELTCFHYVDGGLDVATYAKNLIWNVKGSQCPSGSLCTQDPLLTNMSMTAFDALPRTGSPLIDQAMAIAGFVDDFLLQPRPVGPASDIGAIEVQGGTPPPVCTRAAPTLGLTGPTTAMPAGTTASYTMTLGNNDSGACANTSFALASSVPSGWTGVLSSAITLAPGSSGTAILQVTSTGNAVAGSYGVGVGVSSSVGAVHNSNASASYVVATPPPVCTRAAPSLGLTGPATAMPAGTTASYTMTLGNNDSAACASTSFALARTVPSGWTGTLSSALTLAPGTTSTAILQVTSVGSAAAGSYGIGVGVSSSVGSIHSANASANYVVAPPAAAGLTAAIATDKASYMRRETAHLSLLVRLDGQLAAGVSVQFTVTYPDGKVINRYVTSGSDGYARSTLRVTQYRPLGTYQVLGTASSGSQSATDSTSYIVVP